MIPLHLWNDIFHFLWQCILLLSGRLHVSREDADVPPLDCWARLMYKFSSFTWKETTQKISRNTNGMLCREFKHTKQRYFCKINVDIFRYNNENRHKAKYILFEECWILVICVLTYCKNDQSIVSILLYIYIL